MQGSVGVIYQQFSLSMATSILFSAFLALTLTPALCATLLKPIAQGEHHAKGGFFGAFNRRFEQLSNRYESWVVYALKRSGRYLLVYGLLLVVLGLCFMRLPASFLPVEDQGYTITDIQLPPGASQNRTIKVVEQIEAHNATEPGVGDTTMILGFSFSGSGQNAALAFTTLKDWSLRGAKDSAQAIADRANLALGDIKDAVAYAILPPPVDGLGTSSGFEFRLQDRGGVGHEALMNARSQLLAAAEKKPDPGQRPRKRPGRSAPGAVGSGPAAGQCTGGVLCRYRRPALHRSGLVLRQRLPEPGAHATGGDPGRRRPTQPGGRPVEDQCAQQQRQHGAVAAFVQAKWTQGPAQLTRYNGYPAIAISGEPKAGYSTGQAMAEMERPVTQLPAGLGLEWTGLSLQERLSGSQATTLLGLSLLVVFLCLAALYESWSIPTSVLLVVPLGVLGAVLAVTLRGMPNECSSRSA